MRYVSSDRAGALNAYRGKISVSGQMCTTNRCTVVLTDSLVIASHSCALSCNLRPAVRTQFQGSHACRLGLPNCRCFELMGVLVGMIAGSHTAGAEPPIQAACSGVEGSSAPNCQQ